MATLDIGRYVALVNVAQVCIITPKRSGLTMSDVRPRKGGQYSLYCYDCGEWVPNTANAEMSKEGCYSHSHWCKPKPADIARAREEGAQAERAKIRERIEREIYYMVSQGYSAVEVAALRRALPLIEGGEK